VSVSFSKRLLAKLLGKKYRDAYIRENVQTGIAYQIRVMREQRNQMSQQELGKLLGKPQSVVSRLEDPDYGKLTLQTLFQVAAAFDVALLVQFVSHSEFMRRTEDVSPTALAVRAFDPRELEAFQVDKRISGIAAPIFIFASNQPSGISASLREPQGAVAFASTLQ
jgi:transcriptional regulator with XRE-family HTH domain